MYRDPVSQFMFLMFLEFNVNIHHSFVSLSENESTKKNLEAFRLSHRSAKHLRFLVCGPVGHGKSSFINSVSSVFQEHVCMGALAATLSDTSFTFKVSELGRKK